MELSQLSGVDVLLPELAQVMIPWIESPSNFVVSQRILLSTCTLFSSHIPPSSSSSKVIGNVSHTPRLLGLGLFDSYVHRSTTDTLGLICDHRAGS